MEQVRAFSCHSAKGPNGKRILAEEVAVVLSFNGATQAVMMATPADIEDFAYGFAFTEGLASPAEITRFEMVPLERGIDAQIWLTTSAQERLVARRRYMAGPVGCGLCGLDTLGQVMRPLSPVIPPVYSITKTQLIAAMQALPQWQALHDKTHAAHCAAFYAEGKIITVREDVGRHNALDKLVGAIIRLPPGKQPDISSGAVLLTSRLSLDMVQKAASFGVGLLGAVSAPTVAAVELAQELGITLMANMRSDGGEVYTHSERFAVEGNV